jgi:hypothetical protein
MECTNSELNKLISWSSSRYNDMKKADVIMDIVFRIEKGENCTVEYRSGCYSEAANNLKVDCKWTGGNYTLEIKDGINTLKNNVHDVRAVNPEEINIDKLVLNKYFTPAQKIKVTGNPVGTRYWYINNADVIGKDFTVIGQNIDCFQIEYQGYHMYIRKADSLVVEDERGRIMKDKMTLEQFVSEHSNEGIEIMSPGGFVTIRPDQPLNELSTHAGVSGTDMSVSWDELRMQIIKTCNYNETEGKWYLFTNVQQTASELPIHHSQSISGRVTDARRKATEQGHKSASITQNKNVPTQER